MAAVGTYGCLWGPMAACGDLWGPKGAYGDLWGPMGAYGGLWGPMGTYGDLKALWGPMGTTPGNVPFISAYGMQVPIGTNLHKFTPNLHELVDLSEFKLSMRLNPPYVENP